MRGTARERLEPVLTRIERINPTLNAIVVSNPRARDDADALDRQAGRGPMHGLPVTVKEAFDIAGLATTVNSRLLRGHIAKDDAFVVARLRAAGAVIVGKTNVPPWLGDYQCFGPNYPAAANPFDQTRTPGGSSGGGAAAVAAGLSVLDIGSDLAGSIRVPAHFCGVFGFKPGDNFMRLGDGHVPPWPGRHYRHAPMVSIGVLARSMVDIERGWRAIDPQAGAASIAKPLRIGWYDRVGDIRCDVDTASVLHDMLCRVHGLGVAVERRPLDSAWLEEAYDIWARLGGVMAGEGASWPVRQAMKWMFGWAGGGTSIAALRNWTRGLDLDAGGIARLMQRRDELIAAFEQHMAGCDFLIGPVAAGPAFHHDQQRRPILRDGARYPYLDYAMPFLVMFNAGGNPALVVPAGRSGEGLPIGLQIAAPRFGEARLIACGRWLEQQGAARFVPPRGA